MVHCNDQTRDFAIDLLECNFFVLNLNFNCFYFKPQTPRNYTSFVVTINTRKKIYATMHKTEYSLLTESVDTLKS